MKRPLALVFASLLTVVACGSDDGGGGGASNPCKIDAGSDDCQGRGATTVKYDCDSVDQRKTAEGLGCVPQDPKDDTDRDVCCVPAGGGTNNPPGGSGGKTVPCDTKEGEDDCAARVGYTKKFDCDTREAREEGIAAGCVLENEDKPDSNDLCCPAA